MRNILARGGVEFIAVVLGITISFWLDNQKEEWNNRKIEINLLESIISDIESIKTYNQQRSEVFELDNAVMDYVSTNWESLNVDSIAIILSTSGYKSSIHNMFFDYREFHPPISSLRMVLNNGSINLINSKKVKSLISRLINTDYGFISKNVDAEIALQIELRNIIMKDNNYKDQILRYFQHNYKIHPKYITVKCEENNSYTCKLFQGDEHIETGYGNSKKKSEQDASRKALIKYHVISD